MSVILEIKFKYSENRQTLESTSEQVAAKFINVPGLLWKIWLVDADNNTAGGIYHFDSRQSAEQYAASDLVSHLKAQRGDISLQIFDTIAAAGKVTSAP